jgi:5-methyltetrahydrofolate--homocysteine methyltransferase
LARLDPTRDREPQVDRAPEFHGPETDPLGPAIARPRAPVEFLPLAIRRAGRPRAAPRPLRQDRARRHRKRHRSPPLKPLGPARPIPMTRPAKAALLHALDQRRPLLLDGAMGSQLLSSGFDLRRDFRSLAGSVDVLNLTRPEQVQAVHESYLDCGARVLRTNTFLSSPPALAERGLAREARALWRAAARAGREALEAWCGPDDPGFLLGDFGPPAWKGAESEAAPALERAVAEQAAALAEGGVDGLLLETVTDLAWLEAALRGLHAGAPGLPALISAAVDGEGRLPRGGDLAGLGKLAAEAGAALVALNCMPAPAAAVALLPRLAAAFPGRLGLWPAAGEPGRAPLEPEAFAAALAPALSEPRLALLGACCGSRPAHLLALARRLGRAPEEPAEEAMESEQDPPGAEEGPAV